MNLLREWIVVRLVNRDCRAWLLIEDSHMLLVLPKLQEWEWAWPRKGQEQGPDGQGVMPSPSSSRWCYWSGKGWCLHPGVVTSSQACREHLVFVLMHRWSKKLTQQLMFLCSKACPGSLNMDFSLCSLSSLLALENRTFFDILSNLSGSSWCFHFVYYYY